MQRALYTMQCVHRSHIDLKTALSPGYAHVGMYGTLVSIVLSYFTLDFVKVTYILCVSKELSVNT